MERIICEIIGRLYPKETQVSTFFEVVDKEAVASIDYTPYINQIVGKFNEATLLKDYFTLQ